MTGGDLAAGKNHRGRNALMVAAAAGLLGPVAAQVRIRRPDQPASDRWRQVPVEPAGGTLLGISFRPLQAEALGLDPRQSLTELLAYPFPVIRLAAYWNRIERPARADAPRAEVNCADPDCADPDCADPDCADPDCADPDCANPDCPGHDWAELDWMVAAAERAGKQVILCVGPVKAFGYPEFFVPPHRLAAPLPEGALIGPAGYPDLLRASTGFARRVVRRYAGRRAVIAWQVEHEAVDPLGAEHSWRLSESFALAEVDAVRAADPGRPVLMNGFLPTSVPVAASQWWRTRDQGDSLAVAQRLADIVGIDYYPRHALIAAAGRSVYLDGSRSRWQQRRRRRLLRQAAAAGRPVLIAEGQAEPWEAVTVPPSPAGRAMYSCQPQHLIETYSQCQRWSRKHGGRQQARGWKHDGVGQQDPGLWAYLFWGAEYWLLRDRQGDPRYLAAFRRVLQEA